MQSVICCSSGDRCPARRTAWCESATPSPAAEDRPTPPSYERRDRFYLRAKQEGFRSRAAYKLQDLLRRVPPLRAGDAVVDLGSWPGSWLQVLAERVGVDGCVIGVDIEPIDALGDPVQLLEVDMTQADVPERIASALGERRASLVLSDAAPKLCGIKDVDRAAIEELHDAALAVAERVLAPRGSLIVKAFPGPESQAFRKRLAGRFDRVAEVRPDGKRSGSKEFYWIASAGTGGSSSRRGRSGSRKRTRSGSPS